MAWKAYLMISIEIERFAILRYVYFVIPKNGMNQTQMICLENKFAVYLSEIDNLNHVDDFFSDASWYHSYLYFCKKKWN